MYQIVNVGPVVVES